MPVLLLLINRPSFFLGCPRLTFFSIDFFINLWFCVLQTTGPFLQLAAVVVMTFLSWFIARNWMWLISKSEYLWWLFYFKLTAGSLTQTNKEIVCEMMKASKLTWMCFYFRQTRRNTRCVHSRNVVHIPRTTTYRTVSLYSWPIPAFAQTSSCCTQRSICCTYFSYYLIPPFQTTEGTFLFRLRTIVLVDFQHRHLSRS